MVCTVHMGDNDMRKPRPRTKLVSTLCNSTNFSVHPRRLFLSSKCSSMVVLNDGIHFKAISWQTSGKYEFSGLDWTTGHGLWNGVLEWTTGLEYWTVA
jgi:hypothetical protein